MRFRLLLASAVSVICGVLLFVLFMVFVSDDADVNMGSGYALLIMNESENDSLVRETLSRGGIEGVISESTQQVALDDFGQIKMLPLDSFQNLLEPFDPRDDGYARKLRAFFVREGRRFFFLPYDDSSGNSGAKLKKRVVSILEDTPFSLTVLGGRTSRFLYFALVAASCAGALYLCRARRFFIFEVPVLFASAWADSYAFVLAALLAGIWELLREPLAELCAVRRYARRTFDYAGSGFKGLLERLKPFRLNCVFVLLFLTAFFGFSLAAEIPPFIQALMLVFFFLIYFLAVGAESERNRKNRHILFTPVPLHPFKKRTFCFYPFLLPYAAAALAAVFLLPLFSGFSFSRKLPETMDPRYFVSSEDYEKHIAFQSSFSFRPLYENTNLHSEPELSSSPASSPGASQPVLEVLNQEGYLGYYLGEDGLIAGSVNSGHGLKANSRTFAPFPLEKLMEFLVDYSKLGGSFSEESKKASSENTALSSLIKIKDWIRVAVILALCSLDWLHPGALGRKKKNIPFFGDKRIAA